MSSLYCLLSCSSCGEKEDTIKPESRGEKTRKEKLRELSGKEKVKSFHFLFFNRSLSLSLSLSLSFSFFLCEFLASKRRVYSVSPLVLLSLRRWSHSGWQGGKMRQRGEREHLHRRGGKSVFFGWQVARPDTRITEFGYINLIKQYICTLDMVYVHIVIRVRAERSCPSVSHNSSMEERERERSKLKYERLNSISSSA